MRRTTPMTSLVSSNYTFVEPPANNFLALERKMTNRDFLDSRIKSVFR